jgi:5'-methylthioadenosine phosphorylase
MGVTEIISVSACGSLDEDLAPGTFVLVDQFIDRTFARQNSFFGSGMVAHVSMANPVCSRLMDRLALAGEAADVRIVRGGTYLAMEGPQFSSRAESEMYRQWGCQVIGMTNMPEAKLAREAEICYATVAMVTDFDCWHPDHENVDVSAVISVLLENSAKVKSLIVEAVPHLEIMDRPCPSGCHHALENALITAPEARDKELLAKLDAVAGRVL